MARKPRETAVISEIDSVVRHGGVVKGQRRAAKAGAAPPPPTPEELELEREMEYFVEPQEAFTRDEIE
jgi:hypothetical protein